MVDDGDPVVRRIVLELLNNRYSVILASTGVQLPDLLQRHQPNLVILDVMLPWVNGFELCRIIKTHAQGQETPVLFLTSCKRKGEDLMTGREVGASGYLTKPFLRQRSVQGSGAPPGGMRCSKKLISRQPISSNSITLSARRLSKCFCHRLPSSRLRIYLVSSTVHLHPRRIFHSLHLVRVLGVSKIIRDYTDSLWIKSA